MKQKDKKSLIKLGIEFVKLQLAGNILFWGTYLGFFLLHEFFGVAEISSLIVSSLIAHGLFFLANRNWVFDDKTGQRKTSGEVVRFVIFMGVNFLINIGIIQTLSIFYGITPYIGQFISAMFFVAWNFIGLKWWVFETPTTKRSTKSGKRSSKKTK
jgi:putative flippase GtrA